MATYNFKGKSYATSASDVSIRVIMNGQTVYDNTITSFTDDSNAKIDANSLWFTFDTNNFVSGHSYPLTIHTSGTNGIVWFGEITRNSTLTITNPDGTTTTEVVEEFLAPISAVSDGKLNVTIDSTPQPREPTNDELGSWQYQIPVGSTFACDVNVENY